MNRRHCLGSSVICVLGGLTALITGSAPAVASEVLRAGIVGCDTSHVIAFTRLLNDPQAKGNLANVQVVAAFPGGSDDLPASRDRVGMFTEQLREMGVEIVDSLDELPSRCDVFLLESVDGRVHLEQFRAIAQGRPVFIDKPAAATLAELMAIFQIAQRTGTPCFSSSALRFCNNVQQLRDDAAVGEILGAATSSPYQVEPHHPDLFWYAIHGVESLYALLGTGCEQVSRTETATAGVVVGQWKDGRIGTFRGLKAGPGGASAYTFTVFGRQDVRHASGFDGYEPLVQAIADFFHSGKPPVSSDETIELFAFMEAADESKRRGGSPVAIQEIIERARQEADRLVAK